MSRTDRGRKNSSHIDDVGQNTRREARRGHQVEPFLTDGGGTVVLVAWAVVDQLPGVRQTESVGRVDLHRFAFTTAEIVIPVAKRCYFPKYFSFLPFLAPVFSSSSSSRSCFFRCRFLFRLFLDC